MGCCSSSPEPPRHGPPTKKSTEGLKGSSVKASQQQQKQEQPQQKQPQQEQPQQEQPQQLQQPQQEQPQQLQQPQQERPQEPPKEADVLVHGANGSKAPLAPLEEVVGEAEEKERPSPVSPLSPVEGLPVSHNRTPSPLRLNGSGAGSPVGNASFNTASSSPDGQYQGMASSPQHLSATSVYGLPLNMSFSLRSPPEGTTSQAPPDCSSIVRSVRKTEGGRRDSIGEDSRRGSLPFIQGVTLTKSDSNLATYLSPERRRSSDASSNRGDLGDKSPESEAPSIVLDATQTVKTPVEAWGSGGTMGALSVDAELGTSKNFLSVSGSGVPQGKRQMSFVTDHLARTMGGHEYEIKISTCDPEPTKHRELDILQGDWEDSADNTWTVEGRQASVLLKSTGEKEVHMLEDSTHHASMGRILLMGSLVARHEWSQIVWTDGDVWQQVWAPAKDVDVYYGEEEGWYGGKIKERYPNGCYSIVFDDGEVAENVQGGHMRNREKDLVETVHLLPPINPHI